jgi:hypothetical protein
LRIAARLPGEDSAHYQKREDSYVEILAEAADSTASARVVPLLRNTSAANVTLWRRAAASGVSAKSNEASAHTLSLEMLTTLQLVIDAFANLREARP